MVALEFDAFLSAERVDFGFPYWYIKATIGSDYRETQFLVLKVRNG